MDLTCTAVPMAIVYLHQVAKQGNRGRLVDLGGAKVARTAVHIDITDQDQAQFPSLLKDAERVYIVYEKEPD